jgi:hypothetical protein
MVECAFGILSNKWRIFHTPILVQPEFSDIIVKSACILHNFVRKRDGVNFSETDTHPFTGLELEGQNIRAQGTAVRDYMADYFMGAGAVEFQIHHMF